MGILHDSITTAGAGSKGCVVTLVGRKTGLMLIGKPADRTADSPSRRLNRLIRGAGRVETLTADNGTESRGYGGSSV